MIVALSMRPSACRRWVKPHGSTSTLWLRWQPALLTHCRPALQLCIGYGLEVCQNNVTILISSHFHDFSNSNQSHSDNEPTILYSRFDVNVMRVRILLWKCYSHSIVLIPVHILLQFWATLLMPFQRESRGTHRNPLIPIPMYTSIYYGLSQRYVHYSVALTLNLVLSRIRGIATLACIPTWLSSSSM